MVGGGGRGTLPRAPTARKWVRFNMEDFLFFLAILFYFISFYLLNILHLDLCSKKPRKNVRNCYERATVSRPTVQVIHSFLLYWLQIYLIQKRFLCKTIKYETHLYSENHKQLFFMLKKYVCFSKATFSCCESRIATQS